MNQNLKTMLFALASWVFITGCMDQNTSSTKARSGFALSSDADPFRAAEILGLVANPNATTGNCVRCHGDFKSVDGLQRVIDSTWSAYQCLRNPSDNDFDKLASLQCLARLNSELTESEIAAVNQGNAQAIGRAINGLTTDKLGFFTAGLTLDGFKGLFSGNNNRFANIYRDSWVKNLSMPKGKPALSQNDFLMALNWLVNDAPGKEKFLIHDGPQVCSSASETFIGAGVKAHVRRMSLDGEGWNFRNLSNGLKMFACETNSKCFQNRVSGREVFPKVENLLKSAGEVRILHTIDADSTYWTRSSADGRYISYGGSPTSTIIDLMPMLQNKSARKIAVEGDYDPAFTPDNLSFMFQGQSHGSRFCNVSMLAKRDLTTIDFNSSSCSKSDLNIGLYQGLGSSLDNGDITTLAGSFKSDEGSTLVQDTTPLFGPDATMEIARIRASESAVFEKISAETFATPYIGNWMLSPSQTLAIGTVSAATPAKKAQHGGYSILFTDADAITSDRKINPSQRSDSNSAQLCVGAGEKPQISYDERYVVYYAYEQHTNLVKSAQSSANLFVIDLLGDGKPVQITRMPKGVFAQFPHFRSDGWVYFDVLDTNKGVRQVMATDAILLLQK